MQHGLIVEDLPAPAQWLGQMLAEAFPEIAVAITGSLAEARRQLDVRLPDIALIDLGLPDGYGVDLIRELHQTHPACHCVVTTIYADDRHLFPALRAGASGYLLKDQPRERVLKSLRGIAAGEPPLSPAIAQRLLRVFGDEGGADESGAKLSPRERETLTLIAKGFRLPEVAAQLGVTRNTAAGFIKTVYRKLNVTSRAEATLQAARMGLVNPNG
ncbi:response regulator transcription factor [Flagellatimonas centrodinii]|uniref:response regulator n=1 Tax=Flagellatimonas centrodinii TaxID=2806210 RepID=UPI001FEF0201|nr:response regulator transcription factor [Flagellatimonas centrodinii]ULQ46105.1 response regulator transcription factor [Flagellatimonas centrodinii]